MAGPRLIFITGTDTGVGKTLLTGLLLAHLRQSNCHALALKPFCSGSRADVKLIGAIQDHELSDQQINPFFFREPVAPLVAARRHRRALTLHKALAGIRESAGRCECLLIEGIGGLLVPLGPGFAVLDLLKELPHSLGSHRLEVIVVARNSLGTLNHTLLTMIALHTAGFPAPRIRAGRLSYRPPLPKLFSVESSLLRASIVQIKVVLMDTRKRDVSSLSNLRVLTELTEPVPLFSIPYLGPNASTLRAIRRQVILQENRLSRILEQSC
jgi:dethiobiotin synthetase